MAEDKVKNKAKGLMKKLNPFSKSSKFKGEGQKLGSTPTPSSAPNSSPGEQKQELEWRRQQQLRWESQQALLDSKKPKPKVSSSSQKPPLSTRNPADAAATIAPDVAADVAPKDVNVLVEPLTNDRVERPPFSSPAPPEPSNASYTEITANEGDDGLHEELEMQVVTFLSTGASSVTIDVLLRLLRNILREPENEKFRRIRMGNAKIQETLGSCSGAQDFLEFLGFEIVEEDGESWNVMLDAGERQEILREAVTILENQLTTAGTTTSSNGGEPATKTVKAVLPPDREMKVYVAPPNTRVAQPDFPDSFYTVSPSEMKLRAAQNRKMLEDSQLMIPKSYREKMAQAQRRKVRFCIIRIQFPDGIVLQGMFLPSERTLAIYEFVTSTLKQQWVEFNLVDPLSTSSKIVPRDGGDKCPSLEQAGLLPTAVLKFQTNSADFCGLSDGHLADLHPLASNNF